jgi:hypothetical protein
MQPRTFAAAVVLSMVLGAIGGVAATPAFSERANLIWHGRFQTDGGRKGVDDD